MILKNLPEDKQKKIAGCVQELLEINEKEILVAKRLLKKLRKRSQFYKDFLHSRQTVENLARISIERLKDLEEMKGMRNGDTRPNH